MQEIAGDAKFERGSEDNKKIGEQGKMHETDLYLMCET